MSKKDFKSDNLEEKADRGEATPIKFSRKDKIRILKERKSKKVRKKKIILTVAAVVIAFLGFFGFKAWSVLNNIFAGSGLSAPGLLGDLTLAQLKGEGSGRVNILLLGIGGEKHEGGNLTDTVMIVSIDPRKNDVAMLSVPRDLYVNIPGHGYARVNEAHSIGEAEKYVGGGPGLAKETISKTLDIPLHYYARVDFDGFKKIIDAVGGIDIEVDENIYDPYYPGDKGETVYSIKKGKYHMDGNAALKYSRSRKTTSDFDRAKRQQKVLVAVKNKVLSTETIFNPSKVNTIMNVLGGHIKTDFGLKDLKRLYEIAKKVDSSKIVSKVLDNEETGLLVGANVYGASVLKPASGDYKEIRAFVQSVFSDSYIKDEDARVTLVDSSGISGFGDKVSKQLKSLGYNIVGVEKSKTTSQTSKIYDYTKGKKTYTLKYLSNRFDANPEQKEALEEGVEIKVVIGKDYNE